MLKLVEILRNCMKRDIERAAYVRVSSVKKIRNNKRQEIHTITTTYNDPIEKLNKSKRRVKRIHKQVVYSADLRYKGPIYLAPGIKIHCDCDRFKFVYEYALWKNDAAEIINSDGSKPYETNPQLLPGVCKHGIKVLLGIARAKL